jgi:hypothetical protein
VRRAARNWPALIWISPEPAACSVGSSRHRTSPERVAESPRWSYSTYPPSFQSELLYTDSEKRPEQTHNYRTPFSPPSPRRPSLSRTKAPAVPRPAGVLFLSRRPALNPGSPNLAASECPSNSKIRIRFHLPSALKAGRVTIAASTPHHLHRYKPSSRWGGLHHTLSNGDEISSHSRLFQ